MPKKRIKREGSYEVDQSGKVEDTARDTVLAISNGKSFSLRFRAKDKRLLQSTYRKLLNRNRQFVYETFAALLYLLIKYSRPKGKIVVDTEYPGKDDLINLLYTNFYEQQISSKKLELNYGYVGKHSSAHVLAYLTLKKKKTASKVVSFNELTDILFATKKDRVF